MALVYVIAKWDETFEVSDAKRAGPNRPLLWVAMPTKHDGKRYRRLARDPEAVPVFCAWCLICQVAAKMPTRGVLHDGDKALSAQDLADATGFPASIFETAFNVLTRQDIGWLKALEEAEWTSGMPGYSKPGYSEVSGGITTTTQDKTRHDETTCTAVKPPADVVVLLEGVGVKKKAADQAAKRYDAERIREVVRACKRKPRKAPAGWVMDALTNNWDVRTALEKRAEAERQRQRAEQASRDAARARESELNAFITSCSDDDLSELHNRYVQTLPPNQRESVSRVNPRKVGFVKEACYRIYRENGAHAAALS